MKKVNKNRTNKHNKYVKKHSNKKLTRIKEKVISYGYLELSSEELELLSLEIENNNVSMSEVEEWIKQFKKGEKGGIYIVEIKSKQYILLTFLVNFTLT